MPGIYVAADSDALPFDPYELKDVVGGTIRDPYPKLHELCRQSPVHTGPSTWGRGPTSPTPPSPPRSPSSASTRSSRSCGTTRRIPPPSTRTSPGGHGPHHPADGRARAPDSRALVARLPLQDARALGGGPRPLVVNELVDTFVDRGHAGPGARRDVQLPGAGHRPHPGLPAQDYPRFQRWAHRADERRRQLGARRGRLRGAAGLLRRSDGRAPGRPGRRPDQRRWCAPRSTASA